MAVVVVFVVVAAQHSSRAAAGEAVAAVGGEQQEEESFEPLLQLPIVRGPSVASDVRRSLVTVMEVGYRV